MPISSSRSRMVTGPGAPSPTSHPAAVITPVGRVKGKSAEWLIGDGAPGPVTMRLREELIGIQYGRLPDPFGWIHKVC